MAEDSDLERTEPASARRLEQAREEGQVPRSREIGAFLVLMVAAASFWFVGPWMMQRLGAIVRRGLTLDSALLGEPPVLLLRLADLSLDARFANLESQFAHKAELQRQLRERFKTNTRDHWLQRLEEQDLLCAPVRDMREVLVDPQTLHNQMILRGQGPQEPYRFIASPITMSAAAATMRRVPPKLGEHTAEVLAEAATPASKP